MAYNLFLKFHVKDGLSPTHGIGTNLILLSWSSSIISETTEYQILDCITFLLEFTTTWLIDSNFFI